MAIEPQRSGSRRTLFLGCGCLITISICCICSSATSTLLWPDYFGLEETIANYGLTAYTYDNLYESITGEAVTEPDFQLPTPEPIPTQLPTSTFTPFPTYTATPSPTATPTIPPTDTPSSPATGTPSALATEEPTTTSTPQATKVAVNILPTATFVPESLPTETPLPTAIPTTTPTASPLPIAFQQAKLLSIVDTDIIEVLIDGIRFQVKYSAVEPPRDGQAATAAAILNQQMLKADEFVRLENDVFQVDQDGRLLRYVYVGNFMVNAELVRRGLAKVSTSPIGARHRLRLLALQADAQAKAIGIWGSSINLTPVAADSTPENITPVFDVIPSIVGGGKVERITE